LGVERPDAKPRSTLNAKPSTPKSQAPPQAWSLRRRGGIKILPKRPETTEEEGGRKFVSGFQSTPKNRQARQFQVIQVHHVNHLHDDASERILQGKFRLKRIQKRKKM
jgi:hypothetical protein